MRHRTLLTGLVVLTIVLAGCTSAPGGVGSPTADTMEPTENAQSTDDGNVDFYISDEENAIGDFRHLNVTVTRVGFERASDEGGGWVERDVNNTTIDLTELQGANATRIDSYDLPNGTYGKVFVHVGEVNGTLENGEQVRVKLPSEKLQIKKKFTVNESADVDFVFDITVFEAGQSGKYILKPVVSESGTDVPIQEVGGDEEEGDEVENDTDDEGPDLNATFVGNVTRGENATVEVTRNGSAVENATVVVNEETVGTTDADGRLTFAVPENATELTVEIMAGDRETELEVEFEDEEPETPTATPTATPTSTSSS